MDTKVAIATVSNRLIQPKTVLALMQMLSQTKVSTVPIVATEGYTIAEGRNYCVFQAMREGCTHILFVDDDMTFPPDTLDRLLAHGKEIVGVYSYSRSLPLTPTVAFMENGAHRPHTTYSEYPKPDGLFEVFAIGMGVALIDISLFSLIEKPWFSWEVHESGQIIMGEDAWLCKQAREKEVKIYCDPTLPIGHIGAYIYGAV